MTVEHPLWVGTQKTPCRNNAKIVIYDVARFIDLCKCNGLDHKRIINDILTRR